jgi:hypothetical protein
LNVVIIPKASGALSLAKFTRLAYQRAQRK